MKHSTVVVAAMWLLGAAGAPQPAIAATCSDWVVVASPNPGPVNNQLLGVAAIAPNDVWAVGLSAGMPGGPTTITEHWDGSTWRTIPGVGSGAGTLRAVSGVASNDVWAVGTPALLEHWTGTSWTVVSPAVPSGGAGLTFAGVSVLGAKDAWAAGWYSKGTVKTLVEHWNGAAWTVVASPNAGPNVPSRLYAISGRSATDVWAVGFSGATGSEQPLLEHWNGTTWSIVRGPQIGAAAYLLGVSTIAASQVLAVGRATGPLIESWNGTAWTIAANPVTHDTLSGVAALSSSDAWATGINWSSGPIVEHWDGASWSLAASPVVAPGANGLAAIDPMTATDIWAVGDLALAGGTLGTLVEHRIQRPC